MSKSKAPKGKAYAGIGLTAPWCLIESRPETFASMIHMYGARNLNVEEIYDIDSLSSSEDKPVYGLIFASTMQKDVPPTNPKEVTDPEAESLFFSCQIVVNVCATAALLGVLLNIEDSKVDIGPRLIEFKDFTEGFSPIDRGMAIGNSTLFNTVHNTFGNYEARLDTQQYPRYEDVRDAKKRRLEEEKEEEEEQEEEEGEEEEEAEEEEQEQEDEEGDYHYTSFIPANGYIWELDSYNKAPLKLCKINKNWITNIRSILKKRMEESGLQSFNLLTVTYDPVHLASGSTPSSNAELQFQEEEEEQADQLQQEEEQAGKQVEGRGKQQLGKEELWKQERTQVEEQHKESSRKLQKEELESQQKGKQSELSQQHEIRQKDEEGEDKGKQEPLQQPEVPRTSSRRRTRQIPPPREQPLRSTKRAQEDLLKPQKFQDQLVKRVDEYLDATFPGWRKQTAPLPETPSIISIPGIDEIRAIPDNQIDRAVYDVVDQAIMQTMLRLRQKALRQDELQPPQSPQSLQQSQSPQSPQSPQSLQQPQSPQQPQSLRQPQSPQQPQSLQQPQSPQQPQSLQQPQSPQQPQSSKQPEEQPQQQSQLEAQPGAQPKPHSQRNQRSKRQLEQQHEQQQEDNDLNQKPTQEDHKDDSTRKRRNTNKNPAEPTAARCSLLTRGLKNSDVVDYENCDEEEKKFIMRHQHDYHPFITALFEELHNENLLDDIL